MGDAVILGLALAVFLVGACAYLNRFAGGGWPAHLWSEEEADRLRGRPLYAAMLGLALAAWPVLGWQAALVAGIGFGIWRSPAWGYTISLGRDTPGHRRGPTALERVGIALGGGSVHVGLAVRHALCALPLFVALAWLSAPWVAGLVVPFAVLATLGYEAAHRLTPRLGDPLRTAEISVGALLGAMLALA